MLIVDIQSELERERGMRIYVFPRLKQQGKLTDDEAHERLERLSEAITLCKVLRANGVHHIGQLPLRLTPQADLNTKKVIGNSLPIIKGGAQC